MIWDHFVLLPFLAGLALGVFSITLRKPEETMRIPKWPHPTTVGKYTYRDRNDLCYKFKAEEIDCAKAKESLKDYPYESS
jgi:hypothetical protein